MAKKKQEEVPSGSAKHDEVQNYLEPEDPKKKESKDGKEKGYKTDITPDAWLKRINRAKKFRDQEKERQGWDRILDEYSGEYKVNNQAIKAPPINLVYGYVDTQLAKVFFREPYLTVNAKGGEFIERAHILEKVVNYYQRELNSKPETERTLIDAFLIGHGWMKVGFTGEVTGDQTEDTEFIKDGQVYLTFVPWEDVLFDVTLCKDPPYDCKWIAQRVIKSVDEWKDSKLYQNNKDLKSNLSTVDISGKKIDDYLKDADVELFEGWEIWDKENKKLLCVAESVKEFLRDDPWPYEIDGFPYSMLKFNRVNKKPYPLSDIFLIEPQILERIKLRSSQINHIKRWSRQLSVEKGAMTEEEIEKFSQGVDGAVTQRKPGSAPPVPIQYAPLQDEIFVLDDMIQRDSDAVIGQNEVDRGGQSRTKTKTKYELQEQLMGTSSRQQRRLDKLEDFLEEVYKKIVQLIKQFQDMPKYIAITGMNAAEIQEKLKVSPEKLVPGGIEFDKDDIQGEYDIQVKAGSTLPMNKENKTKMLEGLFELLPKLQIAPNSPVMIAVLREFFRELDMQEVSKAFDDMVSKMQSPQVEPAQTPPVSGPLAGVGPVAPGMRPAGPLPPAGPVLAPPGLSPRPLQ